MRSRTIRRVRVSLSIRASPRARWAPTSGPVSLAASISLIQRHASAGALLPIHHSMRYTAALRRRWSPPGWLVRGAGGSATIGVDQRRSGKPRHPATIAAYCSATSGPVNEVAIMSSLIPINPCEIVHGLRQPDQGLLARVSAGPPWPMAACHKGQKATQAV